MAGLPPFCNQLNADKWIRTKFDTDNDNKIPGQVLPSKFISNKIQDGGDRHIEIHVYGHNSVGIA